MRRLVAVLLVAFLAACTSGTRDVATPTPAEASPAPSAVASATPADHVLMLIADECVGLASTGDCTNARIACAKAIELLDAAKVPGGDRQRGAVVAASGRCSVDPRLPARGTPVVD